MLQISSIASNTGPLIFSWQNENKLHCNPLQGNYRVELLHREIPVVITGNEFTKYNVLLFWLHFFPCFINIEIVVLVPEIKEYAEYIGHLLLEFFLLGGSHL